MLHKIRADRGNKPIGLAGEKMAELFLKANRHKIVDRNKKTPFGEIDLITFEGNTLVFIEVKTRISKSFGPPSLSITAKKKRTIIKNALYYIKRFGFSDLDARIDVIAINLNERGKFEKLDHIKNAVWIE